MPTNQVRAVHVPAYVRVAAKPVLDDIYRRRNRLEQGGAGMCTIATLSSNYTKGRKVIVKPASKQRASAKFRNRINLVAKGLNLFCFF